MTVNYYGYSAPEGYEIVGSPTMDEVTIQPKKAKKAQPDERWVDEPVKVNAKPPEVKPEPPKVIVKEFNKSKIMNQSVETELRLAALKKTLYESLTLMEQEDADDIYEFSKAKILLLDLIQEWDNYTKCLNKELELSLPISKLMDSVT